MKKLVILVCLLVGLSGLTGCAGGDAAQAQWKEAMNTRASQAAEALKALAEHPREHKITFTPMDKSKPIVVDNVSIEVKVAADGREIAEAAEALASLAPQPKTDSEVLGDTVKSLGASAVNGTVAVVGIDAAATVISKGFDKAGGVSIKQNVGNTTGDMNTKTATGNNSPVSGGGVSGPHDSSSLEVVGEGK